MKTSLFLIALVSFASAFSSLPAAHAFSDENAEMRELRERQKSEERREQQNKRVAQDSKHIPRK